MQLHPHTSTTALHSVCSTSLNSFYKYNLTVGTYLEDIMVQKKEQKGFQLGQWVIAMHTSQSCRKAYIRNLSKRGSVYVYTVLVVYILHCKPLIDTMHILFWPQHEVTLTARNRACREVHFLSHLKNAPCSVGRLLTMICLSPANNFCNQFPFFLLIFGVPLLQIYELYC